VNFVPGRPVQNSFFQREVLLSSRRFAIFITVIDSRYFETLKRGHLNTKTNLLPLPFFSFVLQPLPPRQILRLSCFILPTSPSICLLQPHPSATTFSSIKQYPSCSAAPQVACISSFLNGVASLAPPQSSIPRLLFFASHLNTQYESGSAGLAVSVHHRLYCGICLTSASVAITTFDHRPILKRPPFNTGDLRTGKVIQHSRHCIEHLNHRGPLAFHLTLYSFNFNFKLSSRLFGFAKPPFYRFPFTFTSSGIGKRTSPLISTLSSASTVTFPHDTKVSPC
jgi:hypothetical protein